jgi:hypothetical protein
MSLPDIHIQAELLYMVAQWVGVMSFDQGLPNPIPGPLPGRQGRRRNNSSTDNISSDDDNPPTDDDLPAERRHFVPAPSPAHKTILI